MSQRTREHWIKQARNVLKGELARRGINYDELETWLKKIGVTENVNNLRAKINRGTLAPFSFCKFCMRLDVKR